MVQVTFVVALVSFCFGLVHSAPVALKPRAFELLDYADFQISDGVAGQAAAEANAVFVDPFDNVDLATVDSQTLDDMQTMREAAESAETDDFDPAIAAASGAAGDYTSRSFEQLTEVVILADALQVGKIKNKVLKLTGEVQVLNIKIAQAQASGDDTSDLEDSLAEEQTKLNTNIATDVKNAGQTSQSVV
ncbi:hypothetical protein EV421DRAFT_1016303 [Armillaria borealis]|uniref:Small secreted protein n=1 Tax=Armillaria borealis TaxID=47425 RepID=A0AA39MJU0_9AGAR|nr:hypothetical protein EV421DRAFT_1016303 [Armillaria borealis]